MELELESSTTPTAPDTPSSNATSSFCFPCFAPPRRSTWWQRVRSASWSHSQPRPTTTTGDRWWSRGLRALKKIREWSEIVAGPRWKTFIRRFNRNRACKRVAAKYQYDPLSYALNFDEGQSGDFQKEDPHEALRNFSSRYASANMNMNMNVNAKAVSTTETSSRKDDAVFV